MKTNLILPIRSDSLELEFHRSVDKDDLLGCQTSIVFKNQISEVMFGPVEIKLEKKVQKFQTVVDRFNQKISSYMTTKYVIQSAKKHGLVVVHPFDFTINKEVVTFNGLGSSNYNILNHFIFFFI